MDFLKQKGPLAREFCNTLIYIISLVSLKPSSLQRVLTELQWNGMWFFSLAFFAVIFMEMLSDFLLVTDRCTAWKALNGNVSEAEFHNLQQIEEYFNKILKAVQKELHSSNTVIGSFMCQGKMPLSVRQRYEGMKKQPIHLPNLDALIENFDNALSHPDADDLERLKQAVK